ncbi:hypothetical protein [Nocardiopsis synnemataformans]|uniref:hypothetical protein n=1 Tax=Nocardiopsis synnemataformans TaxID=61305 RepID=UPI003EBFB78F
MASLTQIRAALADTLNQLEDLVAYKTVPDSPLLPCVIVTPSEADYTVSMGRGTDTWEFDLYVLVSLTEAGIAQDALDEYVASYGDRSIRQHIWLNRTLGLPDVDAHVSRMNQYDARFTSIDIEHVGAVLRLVVHTRGK